MADVKQGIMALGVAGTIGASCHAAHGVKLLSKGGRAAVRAVDDTVRAGRKLGSVDDVARLNGEARALANERELAEQALNVEEIIDVGSDAVELVSVALEPDDELPPPSSATRPRGSSPATPRARR